MSQEKRHCWLGSMGLLGIISSYTTWFIGDYELSQ
jgi:hypothetical protein